ncbi:MAG: hypothetical protein H7Y15_03200, partial [Pseudonocardia sp.]|nr:hypothetical protein [Pseudonocardia sp.]
MAIDTAPHVRSRRSMLRLIGIGGATVVVAATGVAGYRVFDNGVLESGSGTPYDAWTRWRDDPSPLGAVGAAVLAANPHNTQPWAFRVTPEAVEVFADPARELTAIDPGRREHHIGLGCAVENLALALTARGLGSAVTWMPAAGDPYLMARVDVTGAPAAASPLHDVIGDRHSNRGPYRTEPVDGAVLDGLAGPLPAGIEVRWFVADAERAALGALVVDATVAVIADPGQSEQGFSWFRNDRDDIDRHRDGLTLDGQGMDPLTLSLAKLLPATSREAGDAFWLEQTTSVHTATAAAYGVLTVTDPDDVRTRLDGGRLLQHMHLAATAAGLGLQHMNQVTERIDREREQGTASTFAPRMAGLLARPGRAALATFRVGHPVR